MKTFKISLINITFAENKFQTFIILTVKQNIQP